MASVLLPTHRWTPSCAALADQLGADDELLVLCDAPDDPVARDPPEPPTTGTLTVVPTGEPTAGSGKAHALAVGLERASQPLVVMTDDDVPRSSDWLARLEDVAEERVAASVTPVFIGDDPTWWLVEPATVLLVSAPFCRYGGAWGGGVAFDRRALDESRLRRDLERTVSDDALLWTALDGVYTTTDLVDAVPVDGERERLRDRLTRWVLTFRFFLPRATLAAWALCCALWAAAIVAPLATTLVTTAVALVVYRYLGVDRWTWLLALPSLLVFPFVLTRAWLDPTFRWGGRRYRWTGRFDVAVLAD